MIKSAPLEFALFHFADADGSAGEQVHFEVLNTALPVGVSATPNTMEIRDMEGKHCVNGAYRFVSLFQLGFSFALSSVITSFSAAHKWDNSPFVQVWYRVWPNLLCS